MNDDYLDEMNDISALELLFEKLQFWKLQKVTPGKESLGLN